MGKKVRKQIYISREQAVKLEQLSEQLGMSESALVRETLERFILTVYRPPVNLAAWESEKKFIEELILNG